MASPLIRRRVEPLVTEALGDTRVVFVMGARQVGKSTLAAEVAARAPGTQMLTLDDKVARDAANADPTGFVASLRRPVVVDEVQRAPELLLAIKEAVDRDTSPGQFLLTGSANVLSNRKVSDALTGRMEIITLWPLSQAEIRGSESNIADALFSAAPPQIHDAVVGHDAFAHVVVSGGYPEPRAREPRRRDRWYRDYITTTLDRDLRDVSDALKLAAMPRLLRLLATQASGILNYQTLADRLQLNHGTVTSYVQLLETVFLVHRLPAWRPGLGAREVRSPKLVLVDSGLLAHLLGADEERVRHDDQVTGRVLENFVTMEVIKHLQSSTVDAQAYHYRDGRDEVDIVLEDRSGRVAAIEVKASATVGAAATRSLAKLRDRAGESFTAGIVLYAGRQTVPLGDRLWAVPLCGLWEAGLPQPLPAASRASSAPSRLM